MSIENVTYLQVDEPALRSTPRPSMQMVPGRAPIQAHCQKPEQKPDSDPDADSWAESTRGTVRTSTKYERTAVQNLKLKFQNKGVGGCRELTRALLAGAADEGEPDESGAAAATGRREYYGCVAGEREEQRGREERDGEGGPDGASPAAAPPPQAQVVRGRGRRRRHGQGRAAQRRI